MTRACCNPSTNSSRYKVDMALKIYDQNIPSLSKATSIRDNINAVEELRLQRRLELTVVITLDRDFRILFLVHRSLVHAGCWSMWRGPLRFRLRPLKFRLVFLLSFVFSLAVFRCAGIGLEDEPHTNLRCRDKQDEPS